MAKAKKNNDETLAEKEGTSSGKAVAPKEGAIIQPIAFEIKLKSIHPQATYGRCGYRFNKETAVEIPCEALTGEQVMLLSEDPYLDLMPVVEGDA